MPRRGNYQRNAKDKGYALRLDDGFDIDIDYVVANDNPNPPLGEGGEDAPLCEHNNLSPLQVASPPAVPPPAAAAASSSSSLSDGSEEGIAAAGVVAGNGGFGYDEAFQKAMRDSRALYRQDNNDNINIINDSTNVIGGDEGTNSPVEGVATAGAGVAVDHHQNADTAAITSYNGGFGGDYEANEAAFEAEMHAARAEDTLSDSSIMATKKKHVKGSSSINFFSPITNKRTVGGSPSPHPHVTPSPNNQSMPSNNKKKRKKSTKKRQMPSKQQLKSPPAEDTTQKKLTSYPTAPPDGKMLYNRLIDTDRGVLSLTDGKNANTHTLPPSTRYTFSDIIRIDSEAKASVQHHSGGSTVLVQNDSGTRELIQATLAGAHLFYDEKTDEPPCSICGKSPAKTCRKKPEVVNDNGPNGRHKYTLTHCYACSLDDDPEGGLFFTDILCVNRDGERSRERDAKCINCLNDQARALREKKQETKHCIRCNRSLEHNRGGTTTTTKSICTREDSCGKWCAYQNDQGGWCTADRLGQRHGKATSPYCDRHHRMMRVKAVTEWKQRKKSGESLQWQETELDDLVGLMRSEEAKRVAERRKHLDRMKIAREFRSNPNHSIRWTEQKVKDKISTIKKGRSSKYGKNWMKDGDEKKKGSKK